VLVCSWVLWAAGFGASIAAASQPLTFSTRLVIIVATVLAVALVHEFAHALTLHRFGGRVREMGLTTVAFCPCFYCDITDSYLLPHRYQRIAVALAGPFAQAVLGGLATLWLFVDAAAPAPVRFAIACTAFSGLLSIANLFPFARTDGYFVLTELLEVPNLRRRARQQWRRWWSGAIDGGTQPGPGWAIWLYAVPSTAFAVWMAARMLRALTRAWLPAAAGVVIASVPLVAGPVRGQIVDQQGRPLAGAIVSARDATGRDEASAMSDIRGEFVLQIPDDWPPADVQATAAGTATAIAARAVPASESVELGVVSLPPARVIDGVVRDEERQPVAGAEILVYPSEASELLAPGRAISDASGRFVITNAPMRVRSMAVRAEGFADQVSAGLRAIWMLERGGTVEGHVVAEDGTPQSDAFVQIGDRQVATDERGQFVLAALSAGDAVVIARTRSGRVGSVRVGVAPAAPRAVTIRVRPSAIATGIVNDQATGRSLAGALVRIYQGSSFTLGPTSISFTTATDRNGRFNLGGLLPGLYTVETIRLGYNRSVRPEVRLVAGANDAIAIALSPESRIAGRIVDERGQPIAGATVAAVHPNPLEQVARMLRAGRTQNEAAMSDTSGRFVLRGLAAGRGLRLEVAAPEFAAARFGGVDLDPGAVRTDIVITLHRGLPLVGFVVDSSDRPVAGAAIRYLRLEESAGMPLQAPIQERPSVAAYTDANGQFVVSGLAAGRYDFAIAAEGYSTVYLRGRQIWPSTSSALPKIVLPPGVAITGHVVTAAGDPVAGARVSDVDLTRGIRSTTTDSAGAFELGELSEGQPVSVQVDAPGFSTINRALRAPAEDVVFQMAPATSLRGRVVHADTGSPVTEFSVERLARAPGQTTLRFGSSAAVQFRSDDGRFEMEKVPAGPATLRVKAAGFRPAEIASLALPTAEEIVVAMKPGARVEGRVLDATSRRPIANAMVSWREGDSADPAEEMMLALGLGERTTISDGNGQFLLTDLPPSRITISVNHQEHPALRRTVEAARERRVEILLGEGAEVTGQVIADATGPVPGATVSLTPAGEQSSREAPQTAVSDGSGRFRFTHVRPATYTIEARSSSGVAPRQALAVSDSDRIVEVTLAMTSGTTINGVVSGLGPERLNHVQVMAHATGYFDSTFTDATGHFALPHVPAGVVALEATTSFQDGASVNVTVEIPPASSGAGIDVELVFSGKSSATGVVSRGGRPVAGVIVSYSPQDSSVPTRGRATTDSLGHYEVGGLSDGRYFVLVTGEGVRYQRAVVVSATTTADIELPLAGLRGVVTTSDGEPIESVVVFAVSGRERGPADALRAVTDSTGVYQFTDLEAGHYRVRATKVGFEERLTTASISDSMVALDLTMVPRPAIRLRFIDGSTGAPMSQANLLLMGGDGGLAFQTTLALDANGQGQIPALSPGKYVLTGHVTGYAPRTMVVTLPSVPLDVALDRGGTIEIRCCGGQPFRRVRLVDAQGLAQLLPAGTIGGWADITAPAAMWPNVADGRYWLELSGGGRLDVTVRSGMTTVVDLK
jgi:uncharacterized GH25 family protein